MSLTFNVCLEQDVEFDLAEVFEKIDDTLLLNELHERELAPKVIEDARDDDLIDEAVKRKLRLPGAPMLDPGEIEELQDHLRCAYDARDCLDFEVLLRRMAEGLGLPRPTIPHPTSELIVALPEPTPMEVLVGLKPGAKAGAKHTTVAYTGARR